MRSRATGRRIAQQFGREGTCAACIAVRAGASKASTRKQGDAVLRPKIRHVWNANWTVYGVRKTWRQLCREGEAVARLAKGMGLRGIVRGKIMKTTAPDAPTPSPRDINE
jgi:hypothetical protein